MTTKDKYKIEKHIWPNYFKIHHNGEILESVRQHLLTLSSEFIIYEYNRNYAIVHMIKK